MTVSYTHLDVYKRQVESSPDHIACHKQNILDHTGSLRERQIAKCTGPVSYTHLDVYKRQLQGHWIIEMSEMIATANAKSIEEILSLIHI